MSDPQGNKANRNGHILEEQLEPLFRRNGYEILPYREYLKRSSYPDKMVIKNFPFQSIYQHTGKTEFLLVNDQLGKKIRIECKWQQSQGSVDEKFPYMYLNCIYGYEETEIILIVDGEGSKPGARQWLRSAVEGRWLVDENHAKEIQVMTLSEFTAYFNRNLA